MWWLMSNKWLLWGSMVTYPRIYSKNNSGEIRLFQVGTVHIMKGSNKFSALALTITVF